MEANIKELYFCCTKYDIIVGVMEDPLSKQNALNNFQRELDALVERGAHTTPCEGYEDVEKSLAMLKEKVREKFPSIRVNF